MTFHTEAFEAIGVTNEITVDDPAALGIGVEIARAQLASLDEACSRFRDDSEIATLNAVGAAAVSPLLFEAIEVALDAAVSTGGLVDPTVGASLRALGYDRDFAVVVRAGADPTFELVPASGWQSVRLERETRTVRLRFGTELDLGATAKALAADRIADAVHLETGAGVLVSLGGDIAVAGDAPDGGWPILVTDDHKRSAGATGQVVAIAEGGLATSSTTVRRWRAGRVELHHIVNPLSGAPVREIWRTISVAATSCVAANTASTAALVLGTAAPAWLEERSLAARLVRKDGAVVETGGWPSEKLAGCTA
ncbi:MAG: FAD:protein FMN transferase [Actinomycetota bacterium]